MRRLLCIALLALLTGSPPAFAQEGRVLVLYAESVEAGNVPGLLSLDEPLIRVLTSGADGRVELYREEMGLPQFGRDERYAERLAEYLRVRYSNAAIDVVVAVRKPALDFLLEHGGTILPGVPIVGHGIPSRELEALVLPPGVTVVVMEREFGATLDIALSIHSGTSEIAFVAGTSELDRQLLDEASEELRPYGDQIRIRYLTDLPFDELLVELSKLSEDAIVLYSSLFRDGAGRSQRPDQALERISAAASVPVYGFVDTIFGYGIVGGYLYGRDSQGEATGRVVMAALEGEQPQGLYRVEPDPSRAQFDWRQMRRWGIPQAALPEGSVVRFRPASLWEAYRSQVALGLAVAAVQAILIFGLIFHVRQRARREFRLRESEEAFRTMADTVAVMLWKADSDGRRRWANRRWLEFLGHTPEQEVGSNLVMGVHPEDARRVANEYAAAVSLRQPFAMEYRVRQRDGEYRWLTSQGVPRVNPDGSLDEYVVTCIDIHDRKMAELELAHNRAELGHVTRLSTMGELVASLAHELGQPLTATLVNAQAAGGLITGNSQELAEARDCVEDIVRESRRAGDIIARLRALAKKQPLQLAPLDVRDVIRDVLLLVKGDMLVHRVITTTDCPQGLPLVEGDRIGLQQVLLNLLLNAFSAMVNTPVDCRQVDVSARVNGDGMVELRIHDAGTGLTDEAMDRLFEPFFTTRSSGLGMGLTVSRTLVQSFGGNLWAENNPDHGATFYLTLRPIVASVPSA